MVAFADKSEFFAVLADLLPVHYFEKAPVVRIVWELWISMRVTLATMSTTTAAQHHAQMSNVSVSSSSDHHSNNHLINSYLLKEISLEFN